MVVIQFIYRSYVRQYISINRSSAIKEHVSETITVSTDLKHGKTKTNKPTRVVQSLRLKMFFFSIAEQGIRRHLKFVLTCFNLNSSNKKDSEAIKSTFWGWKLEPREGLQGDSNRWRCYSGQWIVLSSQAVSEEQKQISWKQIVFYNNDRIGAVRLYILATGPC